MAYRDLEFESSSKEGVYRRGRDPHQQKEWIIKRYKGGLKVSEMTSGMERYFRQSIKVKKILIIVLTLFIIFSFAMYFLKLSVNLVGWTTTFDVKHPEYIPFDVDDQYAKKAGLDRVSLTYENSTNTLVVWVTNEIGWNNVSNWEEEMTLSDGTKAYYSENNDTQMISWRLNNVEYAIDFTGNESLSRDELIKVASSIN